MCGRSVRWWEELREIVTDRRACHTERVMEGNTEEAWSEYCMKRIERKD